MGRGRFFPIVALFLAVGPPVGSLAFSVIGGLGAWLTGQPAGTAGMIFYGGLLSVVLSWFVGGIQAAISGVAMAFYEIATGRLSILAAIAAALVCGLAYVFFEGEGLDCGFALLIVAVHVVAAGVCAVLAKLLFAPVQPAKV